MGPKPGAGALSEAVPVSHAGVRDLLRLVRQEVTIAEAAAVEHVELKLAKAEVVRRSGTVKRWPSSSCWSRKKRVG